MRRWWHVAVVALWPLGSAAALAEGPRGPAERPPPGFAGPQYVDSRGCVFLRAGLAGRPAWVPRLTRDRRPLCGHPPTLAAMTAPPAADPPAPRAAGVPAAAARASALPAGTVPARPAGGGGFRCPAAAPELRRLVLAGGGVALVCTPPAAARFEPAVPRGYKLAWDDGRLNPLRAIGTPEGWRMQDGVWTREVPARAVATVRPPVPPAASAPAPPGGGAGATAPAGDGRSDAALR